VVAAGPSVVTARAPHGDTLLYHVAISGDVAMAELLNPHLPSIAGIYSKALTAAVRDDHLAMARSIFANSSARPNIEDALGRRP